MEFSDHSSQEKGWLALPVHRLQEVEECFGVRCLPEPRVDDLTDQLGRDNYINIGLDPWLLAGACLGGCQAQDGMCYTLWTLPVKSYVVGLKGAPATFQRLMDRVMRGLEGICGAYLDSLIISWADRVVHTITSQLEAAASNRY